MFTNQLIQSLRWIQYTTHSSTVYEGNQCVKKKSYVAAFSLADCLIRKRIQQCIFCTLKERKLVQMSNCLEKEYFHFTDKFLHYFSLSLPDLKEHIYPSLGAMQSGLERFFCTAAIRLFLMMRGLLGESSSSIAECEDWASPLELCRPALLIKEAI